MNEQTDQPSLTARPCPHPKLVFASTRDDIAQCRQCKEWLQGPRLREAQEQSKQYLEQRLAELEGALGRLGTNITEMDSGHERLVGEIKERNDRIIDLSQQLVEAQQKEQPVALIPVYGEPVNYHRPDFGQSVDVNKLAPTPPMSVQARLQVLVAQHVELLGLFDRALGNDVIKSPGGEQPLMGVETQVGQLVELTEVALDRAHQLISRLGTL